MKLTHQHLNQLKGLVDEVLSALAEDFIIEGENGEDEEESTEQFDLFRTAAIEFIVKRLNAQK